MEIIHMQKRIHYFFLHFKEQERPLCGRVSYSFFMFLLTESQSVVYYIYMEERKMNENAMKELSETLAACSNPVMIEDFLKSLLTTSESAGVANRWALVRLLDKGMSQRNIAKELGLSLCNITRGSKDLKKEDSPFALMIAMFKKL
jgi:TrpR family transcriptional regulator, trp operon repressor